MIVFNEGTPGAGKSYDAVLTHILPALRKGRRVFARLDGLDHAKIAAYLKMDAPTIESLLRLLTANDVAELYNIATPDSLIVVDEAHMYWVSNRNPLSPEWEKFFAEHRHDGQDLVLISQWYKRLHTAVRARVERKNVFTKLQAVGMKNRYQVRTYTAIEPDKYEKVGAKTLKYDPAIFPLYQSVVAGTENLEVYDAGGVTVWRKFALPAMILIPAAIFGIGWLVSFFSGGVDIVDKKERPNAPVVEKPAPQAGFAGQMAPAAVIAVAAPPKPKPAGVAYVWKLTADNRPRVAGVFTGAHGTVAVVEWRSSQGHVAERLRTDQIEALGVGVQLTEYGIRLEHDGEVIVATMYPTDDGYARIAQSRLDNMGGPPRGRTTGFAGGPAAPAAQSGYTGGTQRAGQAQARPSFAYTGVDK